MDSYNFQSSKKKFLLSFRDEELEEKYKREKLMRTRKLFVKVIIVLTIAQISVLLVSLILVLSTETTRTQRDLFILGLYATPISLLITLIEYLMMKYNIRLLRGILFILICFIMMALDPREEGSVRSYG